MLLGWVPLRTRAAAWGSASAPSFFVFLSLSVSVPCFLVELLDVSPPLGLCAALVGSRVYNKSEQLDLHSCSTLTLSGHTLTDTCTQNVENNVQIKQKLLFLFFCMLPTTSFLFQTALGTVFSSQPRAQALLGITKLSMKNFSLPSTSHESFFESFDKADTRSLCYSAAVREF